MENTFTRAIVCPPAGNFAEGLTTVSLGRPVFERALEQHRAYCEALEAAGLRVITLEADAEYPDSTFVEDAAVVTPEWAVITRPGAASRSGEIVRMAEVLAEYYQTLDAIRDPGTVDGGDVCEIGNRFVIGISERTNEEGAAAVGPASVRLRLHFVNGRYSRRRGDTPSEERAHVHRRRPDAGDRSAGGQDKDRRRGAGRGPERRGVRRELHQGKRTRLYARGVSTTAEDPQGPRLSNGRARNVRIPKDGRRAFVPVAEVLNAGFDLHL